ncbi:GNAT family N-acetyltransferase [Pseudoduganella plicata]|uniref:GCN5 family N-acetyltransferase n=1 Tax=Pseudoduganella plicata TaxID=321984 RepID=A0A4P7BFI9_9BURK|nr:GNAT family N-acetyltransferase [Pseudoduganella plicata]QBQ37521.1 GNAT family N-acetyltransferase [Pseudoduganella plicata]GGY90907.1 GCN5 family N-acetyltransferase [Pseudoduganella plicata]
MHVFLESPRQPDIVIPIKLLDEYQEPLYLLESHRGIDMDALCQPNVLFAVARDQVGTALACGALVLNDDYGELKRIFTLANHRGRGLARSVLTLLEEEGQRRRCSRIMLETGYLHADAIAFYERCGYQKRGPFGDYRSDPDSIFMQKLWNRPGEESNAHLILCNGSDPVRRDNLQSFDRGSLFC